MNWTKEELEQRNREVFGGIKLWPDTTQPVTISMKPTKSPSPKPRMNKWETEYAAVLSNGVRCGLIDWFGFEAINIRLADGARYTPDFAVIRNGVLEFVEVKGHLREAALVRFKVAASLVPLKFTMLRKRKVKEGGGWEPMRVLNGDSK